MTAVNKIDSNATGLRYQEETSIGVANTSNPWTPLEPNSYADFGGQITTVARNPINASRQRKKGVVTDKDASGGFNTDLTQTNLQDILQGLFFADVREKGQQTVTAVTGTGQVYAIADTTGFVVGGLVLMAGFDNTENDGLRTIVTVNTNTSIEVDGTSVNETPSGSPTATVVGFECVADELSVNAAGDMPYLALGTTTVTTLGLVTGEWIFVGGDTGGAAGNQFPTNAVNNGWKRVRSIDATNDRIYLDKSDSDMVTETPAGAETIHLYFGRVLKNESDPTLITRRTYQLERTLGAPDDALPSQIQAEYIEGALFNEFVMNKPAADKITCDLSFIGIDTSVITGPTALKTGSRPSIVEADAFNTSSDITRFRIAVHTDADEAPTPLFAFLTELTLTVSNNASPNKACGVLGAFEITAGQFTVSGAVTAYFADVAAITAVQNNSDVTMDLILVKSNTGIAMDWPLMALGDGRPNVAQDEPITLPITSEMATGAKIDSANLDHTMLISFFDYLPNAADT